MLTYQVIGKLSPKMPLFTGVSVRCLHPDGAAHHIHDVFGDGHAKAGALDTADRGGALPLKRLKDFFGKFRAHADAVVLDAKLVLPAAAHLPGIPLIYY